MAGLVELELDMNQPRPFINVATDYGVFDCLIDTGASMPVWCGESILLTSYYPEAKPTKYLALIAGYGKGYQVARVWVVPEFMIIDKENRNQYRINNLYIAVAPKKRFGFLMIASATMFAGVNYTIVNCIEHEKKSVFRIEEVRDSYYGTPRIYQDNELINLLKRNGEMDDQDILIEYSTVFTQE